MLYQQQHGGRHATLIGMQKIEYCADEAMALANKCLGTVSLTFP